MKKYAQLITYLRLWLLPRRRRAALSLTAGLLALFLSGGPMWWGVVFSPLSQPLTTASQPEEPEEADGFSFQIAGQVFRFKALDLILEIFSSKSR